MMRIHPNPSKTSGRKTSNTNLKLPLAALHKLSSLILLLHLLCSLILLLCSLLLV
jgi:hypothetical protein